MINVKIMVEECIRTNISESKRIEWKDEYLDITLIIPDLRVFSFANVFRTTFLLHYVYCVDYFAVNLRGTKFYIYSIYIVKNRYTNRYENFVDAVLQKQQLPDDYPKTTDRLTTNFFIN